MAKIEWDTPNKDIPRRIVMQKRPRGTKNKVAAARGLALPSDNCHDLVVGMETGLITANTYLLLGEKDPASQRQIKRNCHKFEFSRNPTLWRGDVALMPVRSLLDNRYLDFAFLDLCGHMTSQLARWIYTELGEAMADGATMSVTLMVHYRNNPLDTWWVKKVLPTKEGKRLLGAAAHELNNVQCGGVIGDMKSWMESTYKQSSKGHMMLNRGQSPWNKYMRPEYRDSTARHLSLLSACLCFHDFTLESCVQYRRTDHPKSAPMVTFVLTNLSRRSSPRISLPLLKEFGENMVPKMVPVTRTK